MLLFSLLPVYIIPHWTHQRALIFVNSLMMLWLLRRVNQIDSYTEDIITICKPSILLVSKIFYFNFYLTFLATWLNWSFLRKVNISTQKLMTLKISCGDSGYNNIKDTCGTHHCKSKQKEASVKRWKNKVEKSLRWHVFSSLLPLLCCLSAGEISKPWQQH